MAYRNYEMEKSEQQRWKYEEEGKRQCEDGNMRKKRGRRKETK